MLVQGVRHRFRDKWRSKSPDFTLEESSSQQSSNFQFPSNPGGSSLPRASSLISTDYGFNDWGFEDPSATKVTALHPATQQPVVPQPGTTVAPRAPPLHSYASMQTKNSVTSNHNHYQPQHQQQQHQREYSKEKSLSVSRAVSMNTVNHYGIHNNGTSTTVHRGKSVRFGENRISVFMQDSTQALEECVRLALSYAEETKRGDYCSDSEAVTLSRRLNQVHFQHRSITTLRIN